MRWSWPLLVLMLGGCATAPATLPVARAIPPAHVLMVNGIRRCTCTPTVDGCYTAAHCIAGLPRVTGMTLDGEPVPVRYSIDPNRDLAHLPYAGDPGQELGTPHVGDMAVWRGISSGGGVARLGAEGVRRGPFSFPYLNLTMPCQSFDVWLVGREALPLSVRWDDPGPILPGDSGGGFYVDGKLVGILSLDGGYAADTVRVP